MGFIAVEKISLHRKAPLASLLMKYILSIDSITFKQLLNLRSSSRLLLLHQLWAHRVSGQKVDFEKLLVMMGQGIRLSWQRTKRNTRFFYQSLVYWGFETKCFIGEGKAEEFLA